MKIALECQSLLLQDSLRFYLSNYLCDVAECDFIVSDYLHRASKPVYLLSVEKKTLPFLPERLILELQEFAQKHQMTPPSKGDDELRNEIQSLLMEFSDRFLQVIKKYK